MSVRQVSARTWVIDFYPDGRKGKRERLRFIGTEAEALKHEMDLRRAGPPRARVNPSIREILPDFFQYYENHKSKGTVDDARFAWKRLGPTFLALPIARITPALIETYKAARLVDGVKKQTINRELSYLSAVITWAEETNLCAPVDFKIRKFPKKDTKPPIKVIPEPLQIQAMLEKGLPDRQGIFQLMYDNGLRKSEALGIKGADVDLVRRTIRVVGKGNKEAVIPITTERLLEELRARIAERGKGYLYPNPKTITPENPGGKPFKDIRKSTATAAKRAGIETHITPHYLRHSFGTHAMEGGMSQKAVQGMLRHADLETTDIYTHTSDRFLRSESAKFAGYTGNESAAVPPVVTKKRAKAE